MFIDHRTKTMFTAIKGIARMIHLEKNGGMNTSGMKIANRYRIDNTLVSFPIKTSGFVIIYEKNVVIDCASGPYSYPSNARALPPRTIGMITLNDNMNHPIAMKNDITDQFQCLLSINA
jgi:hypothetical protein